MNALDILEKLEQTSGKKAKEEILRAHSTNKELRELLDAALNFKRKFFIKKFEVAITPDTRPGDLHDSFINLLSILEKREVTGQAAISLVETFFKLTNSQQAKWYARVLKKNLQIGVDISTANKAGFDIPDFDVMLAKDGKECKNLEEIVKGGVYVTPKFDGYRCLAICDHGEVTLLSRNGTEFENFPSIVESLEKMCVDSRFVLDGEIMSDDFNKMQRSAFASKRGTTVGNVKYYVFGWIPSSEWDSGKFKMPTKQRLDNLKLLLDSHVDKANIVRVEHTLVHKIYEIMALEQEYIAKGFEGAMALPNIPYYLGKKSNRLMKFKTMLSQDCHVYDVYEGNDKYAGTMGGIRVIQENGEKCDVGSGFTDEERDEIWNTDKMFLVGMVAEIKYQELTPDGVMRFPIFMRWRNDK